MRKLKLQMSATVNGFVAGTNGESDWRTMGDDDLKSYINDLIDSSDTILMGRKMTDEFVKYWTDVVNNQPDSPWFSFAKKMVDTPKIVFTKTLEKSNWDNTTLAKGNLADEINGLKNKAGKDILVYGGANFVSSLIKEKLIDEYNFGIHPVALGKGMTIFDGLGEKFDLKLVKSQAFDCGIVTFCYEPKQ